jgi:ABC-type Zn2+ transport system substrate-binding protein/surface adhesin
LDEKLYGKELVELLGADVLDSLARQGKLIDFLSAQEYEGASLIERLGGWMGKGLVFRGQQLVAYHKNWIYFTDLFGLEVAGYVERKPGIPPSARHVHHLLNLIKDSEIQVLWASSYFSQEKVQSIAERAGCQAIIVSLGPMTVTADSYFELIDTWIDDLAGAFAG